MTHNRVVDLSSQQVRGQLGATSCVPQLTFYANEQPPIGLAARLPWSHHTDPPRIHEQRQRGARKPLGAAFRHADSQGIDRYPKTALRRPRRCG